MVGQFFKNERGHFASLFRGVIVLRLVYRGEAALGSFLLALIFGSPHLRAIVVGKPQVNYRLSAFPFAALCQTAVYTVV